MVVAYYATLRSGQVQRLFQREFHGRRVPYLSTIMRNVEKYLIYGGSTIRHKDASGHRRTVRTVQNIQEVYQALRDDPNVTASRNNCPNISRSSFNRITKIDLRWHPFRKQIRHKLEDGDAERLIQYSQWLLNKPQASNLYAKHHHRR